ncbi:MAG TPA: RNA-directed DNA polymerase, partial [Chloroflexota bacterium]|nr:RNA-directed DNA polymerase [Chloroflexota bacterium]
MLEIPNPLPHIRLCDVIEKQWPALSTHVAQSKLSLSTPVPGPTLGRALTTRVAPGRTRSTRITLRTRGKFVLTADVASCYRSIYTHSIPWALRSKAWAKVNRKDTDWENLLDTVVRHERNNQTNGIPIGPDTSLLVAEVVLTAADKAFAAQRIRCKGFRFVDDFELVCESRSQAEDALVALQRALKEIELDLNPTKCSIDELPAAVERTAWSNTLRLWPFENKTKSKLATELIGYFDTAFRLAKANKGQPVLRYAIPRLNSDDIDIDRSNWTLYQDLLLQCAVAEPGSLFEVLRQFFRCQTKGFKIRQGVTSDVLNHHIAFHAPLMNASEVAWALFGLIALGS